MKYLQTTLPGLISAVHAADCGSFAAAAKLLDLTPAAVSKGVATLEAHLKVRLFNRTTRRLSLTEEGIVFIEQVRLGLNTLDAAAMQATQARKPQGLVRLNCPVGFGRRYVLPALPSFYAAYPDVRIELNLNDRAVDLVGEGFDIGIRGGSQPPEGMVARKICDLSLVLVATPKYLRARGTPTHPSALDQHDLLRVKFHTGRMLPWLFKETIGGKQKFVACEKPGRFIISDPEIILDAALMHMGIAALGRYDAHAALLKGDLVEVLPRQLAQSNISMSMFYPHRMGLAPRVRVFVDFLLDYLDQDESLHAQDRRQPKQPRQIQEGIGQAQKKR
jgi:DNA-binding transcriptional LysR family regulator